MSFTVVNVDYEGTKIWVPGTLVVKKGTKVRLKLVNNVPADPNQHGFAIPAYNIAEIVNRGEPKQIEFTADKEGIFPIICQLHPAHVGGELVVLP
jgi:nitrosocyanin